MKKNDGKLTEYCMVCPRKCHVNRQAGERGFCGCDDKLYLARAALHFWEEPCISGTTGSGAVFFSGCNLRCVYCQNHNISRMKTAKEISIDRLVEIFFELEKQGAVNINLITGSHYIPQISTAVELAKNKGFTLPFVFNCGGYESVAALKRLDGLIDVYLPDFKYYDFALGQKYSNVSDYPEVCKDAIAEMFRQVGKNRFDDEGLMKKGVLIRHLVLPGCEEDSKRIIEYLHRTYSDKIYMSIMSQYTPLENVIDKRRFPELLSKVERSVYDELVDYAIEIGVENAFIQEEDVATESFIPEFDYKGL